MGKKFREVTSTKKFKPNQNLRDLKGFGIK